MTTRHDAKPDRADPVRGSEPEAAKAAGITFPQLLKRLVIMALKRR